MRASARVLAGLPLAAARSCAGQSPAQTWLCVADELRAEEPGLRADPYAEEPWLETLLGLYESNHMIREALQGQEGGRLRVAVMSSVPEHGAGVAGQMYDPDTGLSPLSCESRLRWKELGSHPFLASDAENSTCFLQHGEHAGCLTADGLYTFLPRLFRADLLFWPLNNEPSMDLLGMLAEYDVIVHMEFEKRLLPAMPLIPGQLRLWYSVEPHALGDTTDYRYRRFNVIDFDSLQGQGFCPHALDPFLIYHQVSAHIVGLPLWFHYPVARWRAHRSRGFEASRRVLLMPEFIATEEPALLEGLARIGFEAHVPGFSESFQDYLGEIASCRFVFYWPANQRAYKQGRRSAGRAAADAAMVGVPVFGHRDKIFQKLLMPPFLGVESVEEFLRKLELLSVDPAAEFWIRSAVASRVRLIDVEHGPLAEQVASAVMLLGSSFDTCKVERGSRLAAASTMSTWRPMDPELYALTWFQTLGSLVEDSWANQADLTEEVVSDEVTFMKEVCLQAPATHYAEIAMVLVSKYLRVSQNALFRLMAFFCGKNVALRAEWDQELGIYLAASAVQLGEAVLELGQELATLHDQGHGLLESLQGELTEARHHLVRLSTEHLDGRHRHRCPSSPRRVFRRPRRPGPRPGAPRLAESLQLRSWSLRGWLNATRLAAAERWLLSPNL